MNIKIKNHRTNNTANIQQNRKILPALMRGLAHCCPACGKGSLYKSFLEITDYCPVCAEALHHHRADDAPAYFTIFLVGHFIIGGILVLEQTYAPEAWIHAVIWLPLTLILSLLLLPRIKGVLVGLQWSLGMHGFAYDVQVVDQHSSPPDKKTKAFED